MADRRIYETTNYDLFHTTIDNRHGDLRGRGPLLESIATHGFMWEYHIICFRDAKGRLIVKDGQNRLLAAIKLNKPVSYVITDRDYDPAELSYTSKPWHPRNFAQRWADKGKTDYRDALIFAENYKIPVSMTFAMLAGYTSFAYVKVDFLKGTFKIKDLKWATAVADLYRTFADLSKKTRSSYFFSACMAVCRVPGVDLKRLVNTAKRRTDEFQTYGNRDGYLDMLDRIYNHGLSVAKKIPLAWQAANAWKANIKPPTRKKKRKDDDNPANEAA
jgi:hypothetical protein